MPLLRRVFVVLRSGEQGRIRHTGTTGTCLPVKPLPALIYFFAQVILFSLGLLYIKKMSYPIG
jgi:hypothetical protein